MMRRRPAVSDMAGALLAWSQAEQLQAIARHRATLIETIPQLKPRSIKRLVAEERLRELTLEELRVIAGRRHE